MMRWLWLAAAVFVADQVTKVLANASLALYQPVEFALGLNWTLSYNTGAAFSFLSSAGGWQRWLFIVLALAVTGFIVHWLRKLPSSDKWLAAALALILGGALGNAWDRLYLGHVVDFIDVYYVAGGCLPLFSRWVVEGVSQCHWPAFNVADSAISVGAVVLIVDNVLKARQQSKHSRS